MLGVLILYAEFLAAVGSGLAAGVFFAFSTFVMRGLKDLPVADGIKAMNAINVAAVRRPLMILLFGTAVLCLVIIVARLWWWGEQRTYWVEQGAVTSLLGATIYMLGAILVTMERNVPLNKALAAATDAAGPMIWKIYLRDWVKWNHVRTVTCAAACALLIGGLWWQEQRPRPLPCPDLICLPCPNANTN